MVMIHDSQTALDEFVKKVVKVGPESYGKDTASASEDVAEPGPRRESESSGQDTACSSEYVAEPRLKKDSESNGQEIMPPYGQEAEKAPIEPDDDDESVTPTEATIAQIHDNSSENE
jgi:hypothetical protein